MAEATFWNGEPCEARIVRVIVAPSPDFPEYWARPYIGTEREAVEITYAGAIFYIDNETHKLGADELATLEEFGLSPVVDYGQRSGEGWEKVTTGKGSPTYGHRSLTIERVVS